MKIESKRFKNITLETYEKVDENGAFLNLITHNDLVLAVVHDIPKEQKFTYDMEMQVLEPGHYLAKCVFEDKDTKVVEFGEVTPATLLNEIANNYPATMAANRAFDRAAIKYLQLPPKCYSDQEIARELEDCPNSQPGNQSESVKNSEDEFPEVDSYAEVMENTAETSSEIQNEKTETSEKEENTEGLSGEILGFTEYKELTFGQMYEHHVDKLIWIAKRVKVGPNLERANKVREFLDEKAVKYA